MSPTFDKIIEEVRTLTADEQRRLRDVLDHELRSSPAHLMHERERAWVAAHRDEYLGQWVALDGDRLLAHGANGREVYLAARAMGIRAPFVEQILPSLEPYISGWR